MANVLIAYYSRDGENYRDGRIVDLAEGNTQVVAKKIRQITGGELFCIEPLHPYPADYHETTELAQKELQDNARPELSGPPCPVERYDIVYLGYPIWWGEAPNIVYHFVRSHDFSGKQVIPFCTSHSSGLGDSDVLLEETAKSGEWFPGTRFSGGVSESDLIDWSRHF